jgi:2-phosphosulfolactate phosphatase
MAFYDQEQFDIRCEWGIDGVRRIAPSDVVIIVDVLSFSTSVDVAVGRGATILPYRWRDETAGQYARERSAELGGKRGPLAGGFSLAPSSLVNAPAGLRLVLPSPNGSTLAFEAMSSGATVLAGCLRNASAIAGWICRSKRKVTVIPAGECWPDGSLRPAIEDWIGAGAIMKGLPGALSPEARAAVAAFEAANGSIHDQLFNCASGKELVERGYSEDVEIASAFNTSTTVPILRGEAFTIAAADSSVESAKANVLPQPAR